MGFEEDMIEQAVRGLSTRQRQILCVMAEKRGTEDGELVYEKGTGYLDLDRVSGQTVMALLRVCALRLEDGSKVGGFERYTINGTGLKIVEQLKGGRP